MELIQLLGAWPRVKACAAEECQWAFYDTSRNRSRTWCSMDVCGNREKTRRYRGRRAAAESGGGAPAGPCRWRSAPADPRGPGAGSGPRPGPSPAARRGRRRRGRRRRSRWPGRRPGRSSRARAGAPARGGRSGRARSARRPATPWALARCSIASSIDIALRRLGRDRALQRQALRHLGQVGGHQRRALGAGQAQGRVDGAARDLGAGEGQEDLVDRAGVAVGPAAQPRAREQEAAAEAEQQRQADEEVLDHGRSSLRPRWATIRTSTPGGVARISRCGSGSRRRARPRCGLRLADHDVGAAALADDPGDGGDEVVVLLDQQRRAEHRGELAQRRHLALLLALDRLARRLHPEQVEVGPEPLRRAPGAPHQALGARLRPDQRQQPLADRLRRVGGDALLVAGPDRLGLAS